MGRAMVTQVNEELGRKIEHFTDLFVVCILGGGLTLYRNNRWVLRGIVSAGLSDANSGACKLMDYVVFTDVSLFISWIKETIN